MVSVETTSQACGEAYEKSQIKATELHGPELPECSHSCSAPLKSSSPVKNVIHQPRSPGLSPLDLDILATHTPQKPDKADGDSLESLPTPKANKKNSPRVANRLKKSVPSRCSPRGKATKNSRPDQLFDCLLSLGVSKKNTAEGRTITLHQISKSSDLKTLKSTIRNRDFGDTKPLVAVGLYWISKKGKKLITLENEEDWDKAKLEYTNKDGTIQDVKLAVACSVSQNRAPAKRKIVLEDSDDERDQEYIDLDDKDKKTENKKHSSTSEFNKTLCDLIKHLESKSKSHLYGIRHKNLWARLITEGKLAGPHEEPKWPDYESEIGVCPRNKEESNKSSFNVRKSDKNNNFDLTDYLVMQEERDGRRAQREQEADRLRREEIRLRQDEERKLKESETLRQERSQERMFTLMVAAMSNRNPQMPVENKASTSNKLTLMTVQDSVAMLKRIGLGQYSDTFEIENIAGAELELLDEKTLVELQVPSSLHRVKILAEIKRLKASP